MMEIRAATEFDCSEIAAISSALGYPSSREEVERRFAQLREHPKGHGIFVSLRREDSRVLGWVHVYGVHLLESEGYAEIGGLVVLREFRRLGAGRALMAASEEWAKSHQFSNVRLRSGMHRVDEAHLFYGSVGYLAAKQSMMFRKDL